MLELQDAGRLLEGAEQAAIAADFESADELLRDAARIQEAELGPLHPDLANTLNNLAIVAEKTGRLDEAETLYRRAVAIATASLPPDHPMIAASRENLEAFCRARGVPLEAETPVVAAPPAPDAAPDPDEIAADDPEGAAASPLDVSPAGVTPADAGVVSQADPPHAVSPRPEVRPPPAPAAPLAAAPRPAARRVSPELAWMAVGAVVVTAAILVSRSSRDTPGSTPEAVLTPPPAAGADQPPGTVPPARAAPGEPARPPTAAARRDTRDTPANQPAPSPSSGDITLATAQLCQVFSTSGAAWRCDPIGDPASAGPIVLLTRVRSASDGVVVHRWYRGDTLRQSVKLTIRANATQGYRTYSRQTVDDASAWRVEVRSAAGDLLHEHRFSVQ